MSATAESDECPHGFSTPRFCAVCKHGPRSFRPAPPPEIEATFTARFDGRCDDCDQPIVPGQTIHRLSNNAYIHQGSCAP